MSDTKHTPTPWQACDWHNDFGDEPFMIYAEEKEVLRAGQSSIWPDGIVKTSIANTEECDGDRVANAAFIVKAVNAHEGLVAALRKCLNYIENTEEEFHIDMQCGDMARAALEGLDE